MPSTPTGTCSSAELPPGTLIAGFRLERVIGSGRRATVYEATQLSLARRVAFKLLHDRELAERARRLRWPEHPGAVSLFGAGESEHGPWLAMRLVPGGTLETQRAPLDAVAGALHQAHAAGIVHGEVTARNVLVADRRAYLTDFGLGAEDATAEADIEALAGLVRDHPPPAPRRRGAWLALAAGGVAAAAIATAFLLSGGGDGADEAPAPPLPSGTRPLGSGLAPGRVDSVDCDGSPPGGASRACTISQLSLGGRDVVVPIDGTITSWAVRGARGTLALQVLRGRGRRLYQVDKSADETVPGPGVHVARADLAVAAGDRVALQLSPESAVGIRRAGRRATTERWVGPLLKPPRPPERPAGTGLDRELLLRVDVRPGSRIEAIAPLRGPAAERARAGRLLASRDVNVGGGEVRLASVIALGSAVAVDLFDGTHRVARTPVPGADGRGRLAALLAGARSVRVRWRNPRGAIVTRAFRVGLRGFS